MTQPVPVHVAAFDLCEKLARAVQAVVPPGFRGDIRIVVDNGRVNAHDCTVQFRPSQRSTVKT